MLINAHMSKMTVSIFYIAATIRIPASEDHDGHRHYDADRPDPTQDRGGGVGPGIMHEVYMSYLGVYSTLAQTFTSQTLLAKPYIDCGLRQASG